MLKNLLNKLLSTNTEAPPVNLSSKVYLYEPSQEQLQKVLESPEVSGKAPGYVYFVQEHMNGSFKIGKTKHVERRMNVFGVKLPFENRLIHLIASGNHHQTEVAFHKHFADKRLEGEWFALNQQDVAWLKAGKYTDSIDQTIQLITAAPPVASPKDKNEKRNQCDGEADRQ